MAFSIQTLNAAHSLDGFDCGRPELNHWLQTIARQHQKKRLSSTFVLTDIAQPQVVLGYYALTVCTVLGASLPPKQAKKLPHIVPGVELGRLATHRDYQGNKLIRVGETLLMDAMARAKHISDHASGYALFVDAIDEHAAQFYERYGFMRLPDHTLNLFLAVG
jgi:GNAT superfamily N-acetyltransferase